MRTLLLPLLIVSGCAVIEHHFECVVVETEIGADGVLDPLPFDVADVYGRTAGTFTVDLTAPDGTVHATTVTTTAGDGPVILVDGTLVEHVVRSDRYAFPVRHEQNTEHVECGDRALVPLHFTATSDDGAVLVDGPAVADVADLTLVDVRRELDLATEALPPSADGLDRAEMEAQYDDAGLAFVSAWWTRESPYAYEQSVEGPL